MKRIRVILQSGREELLPYYVLDHFIKKKAIVAFERSGGWAHIDRDPVRKMARCQDFSGPKKRFTDFLVKKRFTDQLL